MTKDTDPGSEERDRRFQARQLLAEITERTEDPGAIERFLEALDRVWRAALAHLAAKTSSWDHLRRADVAAVVPAAVFDKLTLEPLDPRLARERAQDRIRSALVARVVALEQTVRDARRSARDLEQALQDAGLDGGAAPDTETVGGDDLFGEPVPGCPCASCRYPQGIPADRDGVDLGAVSDFLAGLAGFQRVPHVTPSRVTPSRVTPLRDGSNAERRGEERRDSPLRGSGDSDSPSNPSGPPDPRASENDA